MNDIWKRFDEDDKSTYPPIGKILLIRFSTSIYTEFPDDVGWAEFKSFAGDDNRYYWWVDSSLKGNVGSSPLENSKEPYGSMSTPWIFVTDYKIIEDMI